MKNNEIYLLTAFVTSACDGEIAGEEVKLIKEYSTSTTLFEGIDIETKLNEYVSLINEKGIGFINEFLRALGSSELSIQDQLQIIKISIDIIEADGKILYSEIKFFKKLRQCLSISDEEIIKVMPDKEDYLLPDIKTYDFSFYNEIPFAQINLNINN